MDYKIKSGHNDKTMKEFDDLDTAIKWCDKHMASSKHGHYVVHIENGRLVYDYDTRNKAFREATRKWEEKQASNTIPKG